MGGRWKQPKPSAPDVLDGLTQLVRKLLAVVEREPGRDARSRLLDTLRQYSLGDQWWISFSLHLLGIGAAFQGDFPAAHAHFDECVTLMRQMGGNTAGLAFSLFHLGRMDWLEGKFATAGTHYVEALRLFQALGDQRGVAHALAGLASLRVARGNAAQAARLFGAVGSFLEAPPSG